MPGPPPPSKSYLLKFDSFSDDDSQDSSNIYEDYETSKYCDTDTNATNHYQNRQDVAGAGSRHSSRNNSSSLVPPLSWSSRSENKIQEEKKTDHDSFHTRKIKEENKNDTHYGLTTSLDDSFAPAVGEEVLLSNGSSTADTSSSHKKKKKKKKKKKTTKHNAQTVATTKRVTFTNVHVSEYYRDIHGDGVPSDGGWPLALSNQLCRSYQIDIDDFERNKQMELRKRYEHYVLSRRAQKKKVETRSSRRKRSNSKVGEEMIMKECQHDSHAEVYVPDNFEFETRQFDYKERLTDRHHHEGNDGKLEWEEIRSTGKNVLFGQLGESDRKELLLRDVHLDRGNENHVIKVTKGMSNSSRKDSIAEDDVFCALDVQHVRHELEQIRIHRSTESAAGCSCRKLHVVLLDELNQGHKKKSHHHRRLTERKVKEELRKRHVNIPNDASREDLEKLLHEQVEKHGCCYGNDCPCVSSGIGCQSDTCSCWHTSHVLGSHKKHGERGEFADPIEAQQRCGNKNGIYVVDFGAIRRHRDQFIAAKDANLCSVISG
jgi:hypothetical protein